MGIRAFWTAVACGLLVASCGDNLEPPPDPDQVVNVELETFAPMQVAAGDTIVVSCTLHENDITSMVQADIKVVDESKIARVNGAIMARKVGTIAVSCNLPGRGISDPTPAMVEIVAGPAANVVATVTPNPVIAGNDVTATCTVYDDFGNLIDTPPQAPTLGLAPSDSANTISGLSATMIHSGHYVATCELPGTTSNNAGFDVLPNLPAHIALSLAPDLPVYAVNDSVQVLKVITDRYGNEIFNATTTDTPVPISPAVGPITPLGNTTYTFGGEGTFRVTVTVDPPTDGNVTVSSFINIIVNSRGPAIVCNGDATMLNLTPGTAYTVTGNANDINGVSSVTINGTAATVDASGNFSGAVTTRFGMNFVDITALDTFNQPTTKVCTFLISNNYKSTTTPIPDTVSLKLTQPAVDDYNRAGAINSFGDILSIILNSQGLKDAVHNALLAANPLKPLSCDSQTCTFLGCVCWYSSAVTYNYSQFDGPNTTTLTLVDGGIAATARLENVHVNLRVYGKVTGISYDTTGWVDVSYIQINLTLDTALANGRPHITVRPGSVSASVGSITTNFNGLDGWIINNIVVPLAQGSLRNALANAIQSFVVNNFNATLDGLVSGLDISTLGATFNVPRIVGTGTVPLSFGVSFSSLSALSTRLLFGIGSRFTSTTANAFPTLGIALPPGGTLLDPTLSSPSNTAVAAHVGIFNGVLHALWKANYFTASFDASTLGGSFPAGATIDLTTRLPPVALISNAGVVQLHLGAVDLGIQNDPDLPASLAVRLGAEAHASVTLVGNDLVFGGIVIDQIHMSTDTVNMTAQQQQSLQTLLQTVSQQLVDQSLNNSLPALPIPGFTIPASLGPYGLPAGKQLGINAPSLTVAPQHFTLRGQFGVRP
ncbi:MAG TPA: hypothetical protein VLB44_05315 [Kofleriaceae bacterium]|nr:hypothetical protein [Kofleriaceae bacterium]